MVVSGLGAADPASLDMWGAMAAILGCWFLSHLIYFWRVTWGCFTGIPESGFREPGLRGLDLGFWVSGGLGPCFAPEAPVVRPRASRPEADYPEGRLARRRILARRRTFNNRCAI